MAASGFFIVAIVVVVIAGSIACKVQVIRRCAPQMSLLINDEDVDEDGDDSSRNMLARRANLDMDIRHSDCAFRSAT